MIAIDVVIKVFGGFLQKYENRFSLGAFFWSVYVLSKGTSNDKWENHAISVCNIIRFISIPLFHRYPVDWIFIFATSSIFSFILQKKEFIGIALVAILQGIIYFLLLGLSPLTYWNFGRQFFNLLVWPDDPRQLAFEIGMAFAICVMAIHFTISLGEKILELVEINWFLATSIIHPSIGIFLFPSFYGLHILGIWFSAFLLSIKYKQQWLIQILQVVFMFVYAKMLIS